MPTTKYLFLIPLFLGLFSCKKKSKSDALLPPVPAFVGVLYCHQEDIVISGTVTNVGGFAAAYFCGGGFLNNENAYDDIFGQTLDAGNVSVNGVLLDKTFSSGYYIYNDPSNTLHSSPFVWSVSGGSGIPAINYTYTASQPTYTGYNSIPDTLKLGQDNTFSINGVSGADEIAVYIEGSKYITKSLSGSASSCTIKAIDLNNMSPTNLGNIGLAFYKVGYQTFDGKNYKFKTGYQINRAIVIK